MVAIGDFLPVGFSITGIWNILLTIFIIIIFTVATAAIAFYLYKRKKEMNSPKSTICWWEDTGEKQIPLDQDEVIEITHPGTRLRAFYIKKKDMWLPRFTKSVKQGLYYVTITPQRELVNWTPGSIEKNMKEIGLKFDHTDMLWASENLREFIKKNYRDKSVKWWQAYQQVITTVIYIIFITISFGIVLYMMRGIVGDIGLLMERGGEIMKGLEACKPSSGISPA